MGSVVDDAISQCGQLIREIKSELVAFNGPLAVVAEVKVDPLDEIRGRAVLEETSGVESGVVPGRVKIEHAEGGGGHGEVEVEVTRDTFRGAGRLQSTPQVAVPRCDARNGKTASVGKWAASDEPALQVLDRVDLVVYTIVERIELSVAVDSHVVYQSAATLLEVASKVEVSAPPLEVINRAIAATAQRLPRAILCFAVGNPGYVVEAPRKT